MNVAEIRQRIFDQMDFNPDIQQYRDSVVRRINDHYQRISDSAHWLFLQKEAKLQLRQNITGSSSKIITVGAANTRKVNPAQGFDFTLEMEGQTLVDEDGTEFRIIRVQDKDTMFIEPLRLGDIDNVLDPSVGWVKATNSFITSYTIRFDRFALPRDCIEVLGFIDRDDDRGRLLQVDRKREEMAYLDRDNQGEPVAIIDDEMIIDEPPLEFPQGNTTEVGGGAGLDGTPTSGFNVVNQHTTSTENNLTPNTTYEYFYTIYREGRESPRSKVISVTTNATDNSENVLSNLENTGWNSADTPSYLDSGKQKIIYRRDKTNDGPWFMIGVASSTTTTFTDSTLYPSNDFQHLKYSEFRFNDHDAIRRYDDHGPRQYIRVWYSPGSDRKVHMRYHRRPRDLVSDLHVPEWPRQYHHLLVYLTLEDMFLQMQETQQAGIFRSRAEQMITQMRRRYLSRDDTRKRFMRFDRPRRFQVFGPPGTNFSGADGLS